MIFIKNESHNIDYNTTNEYYVINGIMEEKESGACEFVYDVPNALCSYNEALEQFNNTELVDENSFVELIYSPLDIEFDNVRVMFKTPL